MRKTQFSKSFKYISVKAYYDDTQQVTKPKTHEELTDHYRVFGLVYIVRSIFPSE